MQYVDFIFREYKGDRIANLADGAEVEIMQNMAFYFVVFSAIILLIEPLT